MKSVTGGISFDSGSVISLHDNLNTNGYSIKGQNGGGFEVDSDGRTKMNGSLDLNEHMIINSPNLRYSIKGTFDRDHDTEINESSYFTFDKLLNSLYHKRLRTCHSRD